MSEQSSNKSESDREIDNALLSSLSIREASKRFADFTANEGSPPIHNFSGTPMQIYQLTALACGPSIKGDDIKPDDVIPVSYFYCHWVDFTDPKTNTSKPGIRTAVITTDRTVYSFSAGGVVSSIQQMIDAFGGKMFDPPIQVKRIEQRTRAGFRTTMLVPIFA
jgi:hypothetical protein